MVNKSKISAVKDLSTIAKEYPIVGIINVFGLSTSQLQKMRKKFRDKVLIKMAKKSVITRVFENLKTDKVNIDKMNEYLGGMPGLLFTTENPFKLFKNLQRNKSSAFAKPGQISPKDILVQAGPTPFAPGPIIGELGAIGLKTSVVNGKIAIKEDKVILKQGDVIDDKMASMLQRLNIQPMEVGLDLVAAYENGTIFDKKILAVDEKAYIDALTTYAREAVNLSVNAGIYTKDTIEIFIINAAKDSRGLSVGTGIMTADTVNDILAKAEREAMALDSNVPK